MKSNESCRLELVSTRHIRRMPGLSLGASRKGVGKIRDFASKRGYCSPVVLSDSGGCMTLLAGAATYEACLEENEAKVPAVIVRTEGGADDLMFALQSAELNETLDAVAVGAAVVELIDAHGVPRRHIAETLGKSSSWINRVENLGRKLNGTVKKMVLEGRVPPRSAQEIARLPDDVQMPFAVSVVNELLGKENVAYLVNRYLDKDTGAEERDRIVNTPKLALPNEPMRRGKPGRDDSDGARLSRAIARCMDDASYLSGLLDNIDIAGTSVRIPDVMALADRMAALRARLMALSPRGESKGGAYGRGGDAVD